MGKRMLLIGGSSDFIEEGLRPTTDLNPTLIAIIKGVGQILEDDTALVANTAVTFTLPTYATWKRLRIMITADNAGGGSENIVTVRINNNATTNYEHTRNTKNSTTVTQEAVDQIRTSSSGLLTMTASGKGVCILDIYLVDDRIMYRADSTDFTNSGEFSTVQGALDVVSTSIARIDLTTETNVTGTIRIVGYIDTA